MNDNRRMTALQGALEMVSLGFSVFPLRPGTKDKFYSASWKAAATDDPERVKVLAQRYPGCNWGARCAGHIVLDVDVAKGANGEATFLKLELAHDLPLTRTHASARGGQHVFFRLPSGVEVSNRDAPLGSGINVRGVGGYVVCPGSTFEGKPYGVASEVPIAGAPASLVALLKAPPAVKGAPVAEDQQDHPSDIAQAASWLQRRPIAVEGRRGTEIYRAAARCRDWGLTRDTAHELIAEHFGERMQPPGDFAFCTHEVHSAYKNAQNAAGSRSVAADFDDVSAIAAEILAASDREKAAPVERGDALLWPVAQITEEIDPNTGKNKLKVNSRAIKNIAAHLKWSGTTIWRDLFAGKTFVRSKFFGLDGEMTDEALNQIRLDAFDRGLNAPKDHYIDVVLNLASEAKRHPVRDYLASLKWDGTPRAHTLFSRYTGGAETALTRAAGVLLLVAAVRRVKRPGCKFDFMVVLEGPQKSGKSSFVRILAGEWHGENFSLGLDAKGVIEQTRGKWLIEVPELTGMNTPHGQEHIKALITRTRDEARGAYQRFTTGVDRQWVPIASTNSKRYLTDPTGNRRFLPIEAPAVDIEALAADRDQLWAEAVEIEKTYGFLDLPEEAAVEHAAAQKSREVVDPIREIIEPALGDYAEGWVLSDDLKSLLGLAPPRTPTWVEQSRIKSVMIGLGFSYQRIQNVPDRPYGWVKKQGRTHPERIIIGAPRSHLRVAVDNSSDAAKARAIADMLA